MQRVEAEHRREVETNMADDLKDSAVKKNKTFTPFNSNMAEVANGLSKERRLPAALRPWRTVERSAWTETLIHITTTLQRGGKQPVSEQVVSHGIQRSAAQDFQLETPDEVFEGDVPGLNISWESFTRWKNPNKIGSIWDLCRNPDRRREKWKMMNGWRESTASSARVGRSDVMWKTIKIIWGGDKTPRSSKSALQFVTWHHDYQDFLPLTRCH